MLGGFLLEHFWWGSVFLINLPAMVLLLVLGPLLLPEFRDPRPGRFDLLSAVLSLAAVLPVIYGHQGTRQGRSPAAPVLSIGRACWSAPSSCAASDRRADPMIDLALFRSRAFSGSLAVNLRRPCSRWSASPSSPPSTCSPCSGMSPLEAALWSLAPTLAVGGPPRWPPRSPSGSTGRTCSAPAS